MMMEERKTKTKSIILPLGKKQIKDERLLRIHIRFILDRLEQQPHEDVNSWVVCLLVMVDHDHVRLKNFIAQKLKHACLSGSVDPNWNSLDQNMRA